MARFHFSQFHVFFYSNGFYRIVYVSPKNRHYYAAKISSSSPLLQGYHEFLVPTQGEMRDLYHYIVRNGLKINKMFISCRLKEDLKEAMQS